MTETLKLPVLPLTDSVVLPGMVVPIRLDQPEPRAAVDAVQNGSSADGDRRVLLVPRPDGHYATVGTIAVLEQVGRMPTGEPAAVVRGEQRARIGSGVPGPGAALWVEATPVEDAPTTGRTETLAKEYKALVVSLLQRRNAWQVIDSVQQITDPGQLADTAGWNSWLDTERKMTLLSEPDATKRLELLIGWTREHVAEQEVTE
jgi:ATP-dependent Lon protease